MRSVRAWADAQRFDYRFIDDRFFDYVPDWYRRSAGTNVQVITNLARLLVARELLAAGYERTIWIDADILVFDAEAFRIVRGNSFLDFCIWAHEDLVRRGTQILAHGTTTRLLTALYQAVPFPLLTNVGVLSPMVAQDVRGGVNRRAREYAALHGAPIEAINLGGSLCGKVLDGGVLDNDDYEAIVDMIERTRGAMFRSDASA